MLNAKHALDPLTRELEFLENDGYRSIMGWRPSFIFQDSPTCPKPRFFACPNTACALMDFVPAKHKGETIPCRHIPLTEAGETLETLYDTASNEEIEQALREWLHRTIANSKGDCVRKPSARVIMSKEGAY